MGSHPSFPVLFTFTFALGLLPAVATSVATRSLGWPLAAQILAGSVAAYVVQRSLTKRAWSEWASR